MAGWQLRCGPLHQLMPHGGSRMEVGLREAGAGQDGQRRPGAREEPHPSSASPGTAPSAPAVLVRGPGAPHLLF